MKTRFHMTHTQNMGPKIYAQKKSSNCSFRAFESLQSERIRSSCAIDPEMSFKESQKRRGSAVNEPKSKNKNSVKTSLKFYINRTYKVGMHKVNSLATCQLSGINLSYSDSKLWQQAKSICYI